MRIASERLHTLRSLKTLANFLTVFGTAGLLALPVFADEPNLGSVAVAATMPAVVSAMPSVQPPLMPPGGAGSGIVPAHQAPANAGSVAMVQASADPASPSPSGIALAGIPGSVSVLPPPPGINRGGDRNVGALEGKVTDSVKEVIKNLSSASENVTLEDLNSAKIAIAKIDALIDLEKRLNELDKVRGDREGKTSFPAIPVSALTPLPTLEIKHTAAPPSRVKIEVRRIAGTVGHDVAVLMVEGQEKTVHVGDELADGSLVTDITATGVTLRRDGAVHRYEVKDIDVVYGRSY